jgi:ribosomal-protein-alanine N-acetyltransferase
MIELGTQTITTDRLILRRFSLADIKGYYEAVKDPALYQFIAYNPCTSLEVTQEYIGDLISHYDDPYYFEWVITKEDQIIGSISATNVNIFNRSIELGFILSTSYWHQGYMKEAGLAVLKTLESIGFHKVVAYVEEGNQSSMKLCTNIGMHLEGCFEDEILLKDGDYRSLYHYGLIFHNEK